MTLVPRFVTTAKRLWAGAVALAVLAATSVTQAETLDTLYEWGNAASANATSGAGTPRGFTNPGAGQYTITAGGTDIWGSSDHGSGIFDLASPARSGDFSAVVRSVSVAGDPLEALAGEWGRTGLMARNADDPANGNRANVAMIRKTHTGANGWLVLQRRPNDGGGTDRPENPSGFPGSAAANNLNGSVRNTPIWMSLTRVGNTYYGAWAPDAGGSAGAWSAPIAYNATNANLQGDVRVGLVHQSHNINPVVNTAVFDNFNVGAASDAVAGGLAAGRVSIFGSSVGGAAYAGGIATGAATAQDVNWSIQVLGAPVLTNNAVRQEWWLGIGNPGNKAAIDAAYASRAPDFDITQPNIAWAGNDGGFAGLAGIPQYPAEVSAATNMDNYIVRVTGQIFLPKPGVYSFKDGVDDFTYLSINGTQVINDNDWTGANASGGTNGGSPISTFDATGIDPAGEWLDIEFDMGEGGGGDSGVLFWNYNPATDDFDNPGFPAVFTDPSQPGAIVPTENFRAVVPQLIAELSGTMKQGSDLSDVVFVDDLGNTINLLPGDYQINLSVNGQLVDSQMLNVVPEPSSIALAVLGVVGAAVVGLRRRRRRK